MEYLDLSQYRRIHIMKKDESEMSSAVVKGMQVADISFYIMDEDEIYVVKNRYGATTKCFKVDPVNLTKVLLASKE